MLFEAACNADPVLRLTGVNRALGAKLLDEVERLRREEGMTFLFIENFGYTGSVLLEFGICALHLFANCTRHHRKKRCRRVKHARVAQGAANDFA